MNSFQDLSIKFEEYFRREHFPSGPANLYDAARYILTLGGKRVRPVLCLMGNELFDEIKEDSYHCAAALELFHNFSLIHDDIMDEAPLRRGQPTVHTKWGVNTALLSGDVMLVKCYDYINKVDPKNIHTLLEIFNTTARLVCEGQQMDMDFEQQDDVTLNSYIEMITLKTSVLLACSLQMGAVIGGASKGNQGHLYEFGKNLGIAFQIQDDYLDAFGDPDKFGKQVGGDILANKKTFLAIHTRDVVQNEDRQHFENLLISNAPDKVQQMLALYKKCNVDDWAIDLKKQYFDKAMRHLEDVAVQEIRKRPLYDLANFLVQRDY